MEGGVASGLAPALSLPARQQRVGTGEVGGVTCGGGPGSTPTPATSSPLEAAVAGV